MKTILMFLLATCAVCAQNTVDEIAYGLGRDSADAVYWLISAGGEVDNTVISGKRDRLSTAHTFVGLPMFSGGRPDSVMLVISDGKVFGYKAFYSAPESYKALSFLRKNGGVDGGDVGQNFRMPCKDSGVVRLAYYVIDYCQPEGEESYVFIFIADEKKLAESRR